MNPFASLKQHKNWTDAQAAEELGMSRDFFISLRSGRKQPSKELAAKLERIIDVDRRVWLWPDEFVDLLEEAGIEPISVKNTTHDDNEDLPQWLIDALAEESCAGSTSSDESPSPIRKFTMDEFMNSMLDGGAPKETTPAIRPTASSRPPPPSPACDPEGQVPSTRAS